MLKFFSKVKTTYVTIFLFLAMFMFACIGVQAQSGTYAAGVHVSNAQQQLSFTVGEPFTAVQWIDTVEVADGIQQAYDYSFTIGVAEVKVLSAGSVFPNPFIDQARVRLPENVSGPLCLRVIDLSGRTCLEKHFIGQELLLSTELLPSGMYIVQVFAADGPSPSAFFSLIKQ